MGSYNESLDKSITTSLDSAAGQIKTLEATNPPPLSGAARTIAQLKSDEATLRNVRQTFGSQLGFTKPGPATPGVETDLEDRRHRGRVPRRACRRRVARAGRRAAREGGLETGLKIEELGIRVVEMDSSQGADPLRLELDVLGVGRGLRVISISPASAVDGSTGVGFALARAYADIGVPTLLITADTATPSRTDLPGLAEFLEDSSAQLKPYAVSPNIAWLPPGRPNPDPGRLFTSGSISRLLTSACRLADVSWSRRGL